MSSRTDGDNQEIIHVRCDLGLKKLVKAAAGSKNQNMSDYVRDTLESSAKDDIDEAELTD